MLKSSSQKNMGIAIEIHSTIKPTNFFLMEKWKYVLFIKLSTLIFTTKTMKYFFMLF